MNFTRSTEKGNEVLAFIVLVVALICIWFFVIKPWMDASFQSVSDQLYNR
jgi:hypothetical protein